MTDFESGHIEYIVLGIGINYNTPRSAFPENISVVAGSLFEDSPTGPDSEDVCNTALHGINKQGTRNRLIAEVINQVMAINERLESRDFIPEYKRRSLVLGKDILIIPAAGPDGERDLEAGIPAAAVDIDGDGGLVVRHADGRLQTLNTGEISIRTRRQHVQTDR